MCLASVLYVHLESLGSHGGMQSSKIQGEYAETRFCVCAAPCAACLCPAWRCLIRSMNCQRMQLSHILSLTLGSPTPRLQNIWTTPYWGVEPLILASLTVWRCLMCCAACCRNMSNFTKGANAQAMEEVLKIGTSARVCSSGNFLSDSAAHKAWVGVIESGDVAAIEKALNDKLPGNVTRWRWPQSGSKSWTR